jgi:DNA adenine methylase
MAKYRTPLRYPGGKQKLAPFIAEIITANDFIGCDYAEPFAGGAGVAIELLLSGTVSRIHLNDLSEPVYAFWRSILYDTDEFCRRIRTVELSVNEWRRQREVLSRPKEFERLDRGFSLFYLNRCNRSGIPTLGAGVIGGIGQCGTWKIDARFPREKLIARVEAIAAHRKKIVVKNFDAEAFIADYLPGLPKKTIVYCDPPYYHKADRLYTNHYTEKDHKNLSGKIQSLIKQPWFVSYDNTSEVSELYRMRRSFTYDLQYSAFKPYIGKEAFFFSDELKLPKQSALKSIDVALAQLA